ncbi:MAG: hypothetical protein O3B84_06865 [Chloroflexi bacterium]|nr:hypothetical protein [Chloroflexota bacterium]
MEKDKPTSHFGYLVNRLIASLLGTVILIGYVALSARFMSVSRSDAVVAVFGFPVFFLGTALGLVVYFERKLRAVDERHESREAQ